MSRKSMDGWRSLLCLLLLVSHSVGCSGTERTADPAPQASPVERGLSPSAVPTLRFDAHSQSRRQQIAADSKGMPGARVVWLGDSITERWRRTGHRVWEESIAPARAANLGIDGDRTEHVLGRLADGELEGFDPDVVVLLIGTNNLGRDAPAEVVAGIGAIVDWLSDARPRTRIVLLALFPRGRVPGGAPRLAVQAVNEELERAARGWPVEWVDVGHVFLDVDGTLAHSVAPDALHLSEAGYARWGEAMQPILDAALRRPDGRD